MAEIVEKIAGIVQRVTFHNEENGWAVLRVAPFQRMGDLVTVTVHQTRVFAGATMEFFGAWTDHPQYGRQFRADRAVEKKPATSAALEKYLGSGLIHGVGPKTAAKIVRHFGEATLDVFEDDIGRLVEVPGIARKKLEMIEAAWREHRMVREVMMFLQGHGISTLFAVRIYKKYGERAIELVSGDPYRLATDFYGIGFFSADRVALSMGLATDSDQRISAAIRHVLAAGREAGHCYLTLAQVNRAVDELLELETAARLPGLLSTMEEEHQLRVRLLANTDNGSDATPQTCYYSKSLYYDEQTVADRIRRLAGNPGISDAGGTDVSRLLDTLCSRQKLQLSDEQRAAVLGTLGSGFAVLTGGPGCGKTTTTRMIVSLLHRLGRSVLLAAPTGRAAQRMGEVIGLEAKTIHRLLEFQNGGFQKNEESPLQLDCLLVDECSMLDISLTAALLKAVPEGGQVLFIGDADQLPSVGPGNVLRDIIASASVPVCRLTRVFRQAAASQIIASAHAINRGESPQIESPFKKPQLWQGESDCLFIDSDEATKEQLGFISRVKRLANLNSLERLEHLTMEESGEDPFLFRTEEMISSSYQQDFVVPEKFRHVDLGAVAKAEGPAAELRSLLAKVHPWSTLHYGLTATESVVRLYLEWIPKYYGADCEIQILSPMTRGSLGTTNLNQLIQQAANPPGPGKAELKVGERIFRVGDRVIHRRNNYDLGVFNGDIGRIQAINNSELTCQVVFATDGRRVDYQKDDILELDLAYAITIHKSQGSEFPAIIMPVLTQHFKMLFRNLVYTGLTRAKNLAVVVGSRKAMAMAVRQQDTDKRQTALAQLLAG